MASQSLISPDRLPHTTLRAGETLLKRRTFAVERSAVLSLREHYREAYRALRDAMDMQPTPTTQWRAEFGLYAHGVVERLRRKVLATVEQSARAALVGNYYGRLWLLDMATRDDVRINVRPLSADLLQEDYYDDLIRDLLGRQWREQYDLELDDLLMDIRRAIGTGMANGEDMASIQRRVRSAMGVETDRRRGKEGSAERKGYRANFNRTQVLTRTVVQTVANRGAVAAYKANSDILSGYEWLTARDERVCADCRGMDGKVFSMRSRRTPPLHPQCRCTVIPVIKPDAMEDGKAPPRRTLAAWAQGFGLDRELAGFLGATR